MKKFFSILIIASIMITSLSVPGYASFITDSADSIEKSEVIIGEWKNLTEFGTIEPGKVIYDVTAFVKSHKPVTYTVYASIDGEKSFALGTMKVTPGKEITKGFLISNILNGKHTIAVTVMDGTETVLTQEDMIVVMKPYEKQFMDELSLYGVNNGGMPMQDRWRNILYFSGAKGYRGEYYWSRVEKTKGIYNLFYNQNFDHAKHGDALYDHNISVNLVTGYGNEAVYPMWQSQIGKEFTGTANARHAPHTQEGIYAYTDYVRYLVEQRPEITSFEIWNEPTLGFWQSDIDYIENHKKYEYTDLLKATSASVRSDYKNETIGGLAHAFQGNYDEVKEYFPLNVYPYMNAMTYHFYATGSGIDDANSYEKRLDKIENYMLDLGGWKKMYLTEVGWPTNVGTSGTTEEFSAENMVKMYVIGDQKDHKVWMYSFYNKGTDITAIEQNWGMINNDGSFKKSFIGFTEHNRQLNGGVYVGELDLGDEDIRAFVYLKENEPVVIIWDGSKEREELEFTFEGEQFKVNDFNGTLISENTDTITLTEWPSYINGLSHKYIAMAAKEDVKYDRALYAETYADMLPQDILANADRTFANAENMLDNASDESVKASIDEFTQLGLDIIDKFKSGEITDTVAARATYELHKTASTLCTVYMSEYDGEVFTKPLYTTNEAQAKADSLYRNDNRLMQYSDSILLYATDTEAKVQKLLRLDYEPEAIKGYIAGWGLLTKVYCDWFDSFSDNEKIINYAMLVQAIPDSRGAYINGNHVIKLNANNLSKIPFKGNIRIYDEEGKEIGASESFELDADGYKYVEIPIVAERYNDENKRNLRLSYVDENGTKLTDDLFVLTIMDKISAFVQPCTTTLDEMDSVDLKFTNLLDKEVSFTLNVESDENYSFASNKHNLTLAPNEEKIVELPITNITETNFHYYTVKYEAMDENGIIIASGEVPLNFTAIVKAEEPINAQEFTGDISDWYDAYPIYINSPENPNDKSSWNNTAASARAFLKWDDDNLYLMVDAYDEVYYHSFTGVNIWDGDSVQISIDPKNTKSENYDADDLELGVALTNMGPELHVWQTPINSTMGNVDFINVIRDDNKKVTRYIAAFPKAELPDLNIEAGNTFGMNIAINDADVLARDIFFQFTKGTADSKAPVNYANFTFVEGNKGNYVEGKSSELFPAAIENIIINDD